TSLTLVMGGGGRGYRATVLAPLFKLWFLFSTPPIFPGIFFMYNLSVTTGTPTRKKPASQRSVYYKQMPLPPKHHKFISRWWADQ
ncbi:hypothetical protein ACVGWN_20970, partial [Enterobacter hormaechei]